MVLCHELAHLRQGHPLGRSLGAVLAPVLFWNPLYWWLAKEQRLAAEFLADGEAAGWLGKRRYVEELLALAERAQESSGGRATGLLAIGQAAIGSNVHRSGVVGSGAVGARREFLERMETLIMRNETLSTSSSLARVATHGLGAVLLIGLISSAWGRPAQDGGTSAPLEDPALDPPEAHQPVRHQSPRDGLPGMSTAQPLQANRYHLALQSSRAGSVEELLLLMNTEGLRVGQMEMAPSAGGSKVKLTTASTVTLQEIMALVERVPGLELTGVRAAPVQSTRSGFPAGVPSATEWGQLQGEMQRLRGELARLKRAQAELRWQVEGLAGGGLPPARLGNPPLPEDLSPSKEQVPASPSGKVIGVHPNDGATLVEVSIGSQGGFHEGMELMVHSGSTYKAKLRLVSVQANSSYGVAEAIAANQKVTVGDAVSSLSTHPKKPATPAKSR